MKMRNSSQSANTYPASPNIAVAYEYYRISHCRHCFSTNPNSRRRLYEILSGGVFHGRS